MKRIESTQNKTIKELAKLHTKKERDKTGQFIVEGDHLIQEALQAQCLKQLFILEGMKNPFSFEAIQCTQPVINKLSSQVSDAKMIGICTRPERAERMIDTALFLDDIQDPGNIGTIFRCAVAFGIDHIFLSEHCADILNPKSIQASKGALFHMNYSYGSLHQAIKQEHNKGMKIFAAMLHTDSIALQDVQKVEHYGVILGNEGQGIHPEIMVLADQCVEIEMDNFESLNVATAAAILLYTIKHKKRIQ